MSFDWKTEERDWEVKPARQAGSPPAAENPYARPEPSVEPEAAPAEPRRNRRRTVAFVVVTAILLLATAGLVYRQISRRIAEAEERAETEVLASHETVLNAAAEGDAELFVGFLSGRDAQWAAAQANLVGDGAYDNRSNFGFYEPAADSPDDLPTVTLASDLNSAELATLQTYDVAVGADLTETVTLTQTAVYRRGPDRWLLAPPEADFWGEEQATVQRNFILRYPARDELIARRLSRDLGGVLRELCGDGDLIGGDCSHLLITLSTDPAALSADADLRRGLNFGVEIVLPTPTLFGLPVDEAGYRALQREYAARVVEAMAANYTGWTCCTHSAFYTALLEAQLHELGLRPWPVTSGHFAQLAGDPLVTESMKGFWIGEWSKPNPEEVWPVYALVDFLRASTFQMPILDMLRLLPDESSASLDSWLAQVTLDQYDSPADFERALLAYAVSQAETTPPLTQTAQDLQLICRPPGALRSALYRYDPLDDSLVREHDLAFLDAPMLTGLPSGEGIIAFGRNRRDTVNPPYLWRGGRLTTITFEDEVIDGYVPLPSQTDPDTISFFLDSEILTSPYAVLPLARCADADSCRADTVIGAPVRSPDGKRAFYVVGAPTPLMPAVYLSLLYLGDADGGSLGMVGNGSSPVWLDDETFAYVTTPGVLGEQAIVMSSVAAASSTATGSLTASIKGMALPPAQRPNPTGGTRGNGADAGAANDFPAEMLLSAGSLVDLGLLPRGTSVHIDRILPDVAGENLFIFTANPLQPDVPGLVVVYNLKDQSIMKRFEIPNEPFDTRRAYEFSSDGQWLVVSLLLANNDGRPATWMAYVHATDGSATYQYPLIVDDWPADWLVDWSTDGHTLALTTGGYVRLIDPAQAASWPIVFDDLACTAAAWVNEE